MNFQLSTFNFRKVLTIALYSFFGLFIYSFITNQAGAACEPIYGGGPTCTGTTLRITSQILNPNTNRFVHSLDTTNSFNTNNTVTFQITVTNAGNDTLNHVVVKDTFPSTLTFVDGPGTFDKNTSILTFVIPNLAANHSQLFTITTKVKSANNFSANSCVTNEVSALASSGTVVKDSSQLCLGKLTSTPATGPEPLGLLSLIPVALIGLKLKKLSC